MAPPVRLLPFLLASLVLLAAMARAEEPARETAEDELLLKNAGYKVDAAALVEFFRQRTFGPDDQQRAAKLAARLGDDQFAVRENAAQELIKLGALARPFLREAQKSNDPEVRRRAADCLDIIDGGPDPALVGAAARLLATNSQKGAAAAIINYLEWAPNEELQEEVTVALLKIVEREGKVDAVIVAALADKSPSRRCAAALAVGRSGSAEQCKEMRKLLTDPETKVRFRAAQGLLMARDKTVLPTVFELLGKEEFAPLAEDLLRRLTLDKGPKVELGETDQSRKKCREAWEAWWQVNGDTVNLERADIDPIAYDGPRRATTAATRWTAAFMKSDSAALRRLTTYPFLLASDQEMNADQLDQWARPNIRANLTFQNPKLIDGRDFLKIATSAELKLVKGIPARDLFAVSFTYTEGDPDRLYIIVRMKAGEARILGLGILTNK